VTLKQRLWLTYGPTALVASGIGIALTFSSNHEKNPGHTVLLFVFICLSFITAGLIGWTRRPDNRTGALLVAVGFAIFIGALSEANASFPFTIGSIFGGLFIPIFVQLLLAFPSGRLTNKLERVVVASAYGVMIVGSVIAALFTPDLQSDCSNCPRNAFLVDDDHAARSAINWVGGTVAIALAGLVVWLLVQRWRKGSPSARRIYAPLFATGGVTMLLLIVGVAIQPLSGVASRVLGYATLVPFGAVPFAFLMGLLGSRLARGAGLEKILSGIPERATPEEVQEGLRGSLRDPTLEVAYWYPEDGHYVDVVGNRFDLPVDDPSRTVTRLEYADTPIAALVHDPALGEDPELLNAVAGAARIALERDRLLVEVRARAERYRALLNAMPDLMFRISGDGTYLGFNAPDERDLLVKEVVGLTVWDRLPRDLADGVMAAGGQALAERTTQTIEYDLDFGGQLRHYEGRIAASGEDEFLLIVRDMSERKRHERELEASRLRIVAAGDDERRRLERNLHDGAQQRLVSLSLSLRLAQKQLQSNPESAEKLLEASREELAQALDELRELARGIHPAILTDRGLDAALEALATRAPLPVEIEGACSKLPAAVEAAAYYVVAEALTNVVKYARAGSVRVKLAQTNGCARVEVADDGIGGADPTTGSGLRGLADRLASLNGTLEVDSRPGEGTTIRAEIPLGVG
jgi:signal transduction histidine kinase